MPYWVDNAAPRSHRAINKNPVDHIKKKKASKTKTKPRLGRRTFREDDGVWGIKPRALFLPANPHPILA